MLNDELCQRKKEKNKKNIESDKEKKGEKPIENQYVWIVIDDINN